MISVIIPVYNVERYLSRCIGSVLHSTYADFELILVDDGSTDASPQICGEYAGRDSRVRLLRQENRGVSAARNRGLDACRGEWVVFVDGDDTISEDFLALAAQAGSQGPDLILFDFAEEKAAPAARRLPEAIRYGRQDMSALAQSTLTLRQLRKQGNVNFLSSCARAMKKSVISRYGLRFSEDLFGGEDTLFNIEYLLRAESCTYIPRGVYHYNIHGDSFSRRFNPRLPDNHELLLRKVKRALDGCGALPALEAAYHTYARNLLTSLLFRMVFSPWNPASFREKRKMCQRFWNNEIFRQAKGRGSRYDAWNQRIFLLLFRLGWYGSLDIICRVLHIVWGRKGIC